ncbi:putative amino acid transporter PAT2 [Trypanosoma theileri]|uniref:Putative amino acid transporter PAT2 n=1 Tax=Trypanosoma theileri TaxID=67003 RepID=A0A1X0NJR7_9TRYP|nr:putative amino acid transporter PAT2 [Trypanosoma theileri]ORC84758.1 putative amino acid transporter PAT2 [Trypanosoma theileri]
MTVLPADELSLSPPQQQQQQEEQQQQRNEPIVSGMIDTVTNSTNDGSSLCEKEMCLAQRRIMQLDKEREERVARRRNPDNIFLKAIQYVMPYGGILSSSFNLASSTLGAGIVALPAAFQMSGIGMSTVYLVVVAIMVVYSFVLLTKVGERTGLRSYEKITRLLLGRGADYVLAVLMWLLCFGGDVSYVISMLRVIRGFLNNAESTPEFLKTLAGNRLITSAVWLVVMLPLCLPKEINSLRFVSTIAVMFIVFFVFCIILHTAQNGFTHGVRDDLVYFQHGNLAIQGLSVYMFAYVNQVNCFEVYEELYKPSVKRMTLSALLGTILCFVLYFLAGLFGYLEYGPTVTDSILDMYNPIEDKMMGVAYAGIILKLCVGYGLHMIPCRDALYHIIGIDVKTIAWWKNSLICGTLALASLLAGLFIPRITTVFGLLGSLCGGSIGYVFPALMFMYSGNFNVQSVGWGHFIGTYVLLFFGIIAIVFGTGASIYGEVLNSM